MKVRIFDKSVPIGNFKNICKKIIVGIGRHYTEFSKQILQIFKIKLKFKAIVMDFVDPELHRHN